MSLFDQASICITPNGVKAGKLYSIKPTDGSGDLSVVRATSATRVDANGLVEIPRTNLLTNSDGNLATYTTNSNVSDAVIPINGFANSIQFGDNSVARLAYKRNFTPTIGVQYTLSVFIQMDDDSLPVIGTTNSTGDFGLIINANLATLNSKVEQLGITNMYRVSISRVADSTNTQFGVIKYTNQSAKGFRITGIQLETGVTATEYIPTTSLIRTKFAGITQDGSSASNIPRLDYSNGSCPSILVEPQRTNLVLRSEEFDNASWAKNRLNISANSITAPDGNLTADLLDTNANGSGSSVTQNISTTAGLRYNISVFAKKNNVDFLMFNIVNSGFTNGVRVWFNLETKLISTTANVGVGLNVSNTLVEEYDNDWLRLSLSVVADDTLLRTVFVVTNASGVFSSVIGDKLYLWGAQLEAGSNATSYISTAASAVTRNADVISKTGISSLINSVEGCFYVEAKSFVNGGSFRQFSLSNGTDNSRLVIGWSSVASRLLVRLDIGGTNIVNTDILSFNQTSNNKVLFKWGGGNFKVFINGVEKLSLTSLTMPTANLFTKLGFDRGSSAGFFEGNVNEVIVFPTQLTDDECINLTTI